MPAPTTGVVVGEAPGRVNLIGEHTDYNGGLVLPIAIPRRTRVRLTPRDDRLVEAYSRDATPEGRFLLGSEKRGAGWVDYVQGITWALVDAGYRLSGFAAEVSSDVPLGSGLASSAALEVALLRALREAFALDLDDVRLALLAQRAENEFVGARVGIMDQMAANLADTTSALFIDTRDLRYERVPWPSEADLVVIHSGVSHVLRDEEHGDSPYNVRRLECEQAAVELGVPQLRDLGLDDLPRIASLPDRLARRARHVVTENARVLEAVDALRATDLARLGALFAASHASMRDDYEVSTPEIDLLVELASADPDVFGARLTGGGFGGAIIALAGRGTGRGVGERVRDAYAAQSGGSPTLLVPTPSHLA
jgi:galactokinase